MPHHFYTRKLFTQASILLALAGTALVACKRDADTLLPAPGAASRVTPPTLTDFETWYAGRTNASYARPTGTKASATRPAGADSLGWLAIQWQRLDTISNGGEPLSFLPIEGGPAGIAAGYQGYRRIVMGQRAGSPPTGFIIEVLHKGDALAPAQLNQVFRALYTAQQQGQVAQLPGFTGFAACYTRENYYLTGRAYRQGVASPGLAWLSFRAADSPGARKPGTARTDDVDITCVSAIIDVSLAFESRQTVIWTCTVSGHGGGSPPPPSGPPTGNTGGGSTGTGNPGGGYGGGSGGGSSGGGGGGPLGDEQYDDGSGNGYGGTAQPGSSNPASTTNVIVNPSIHNDPKEECVLTKLLANSQFKSLLTNFQNSTQYSVSFNIGTIASGATGNCTWNSATSTATVLINQSSFDLQHAIWGATTFFHETYHAQLQQYAIATFGTLVIGNWPKPINDMTLQELMGYVDATASANAQWTAATHNYMAYNNDVMAEGLRAFVQANYPQTYTQIGSDIAKYNYLSMMGLENTARFRDEVTNKGKDSDYRQAISDFITSERPDCL